VIAAAAPRKHVRLLGKHAWLSVLGGLAMTLAMAGVAEAYWSASGTGTGTGPVGTLAAPTISSATAGAGTATLNWTFVTPLGAPAVSYFVTRNPGSVGGSCAGSISGTSCIDSGLTAATLYNYTVTAVWKSWTATSPVKSVTTLAYGALDHFVLAPATTTPTAGQADNLTITAKDAAGLTVTAYIGSHNLTFSGASSIGSFTPTVTNSSGAATNFGTATAISFTNGAATVTGSANGAMTLYKAETVTVSVTDTSISGTSASITVGTGPLASFTIPTPGPQIAGTPFSISITAVDAVGNTVTAYAGTQCLTFSGPANSPGGNAPSYPVQGTCAAGQSSVTFTNGAASANVTLYNAASTTITVTGSGKVGSTGAFTVNPLGASSLRLAAATTNPSAGVADNLTITALDQYGNTATSYTSSINLTFSGATAIGTFTPTVTNSSGAAIVFGTATAISFTSGVATVSGTNNGAMTLYKAETANISATGGGYTTNTLSVAVNTAAEAGIVLSTITQDVNPPILPTCSGSIDAVTCVSAGGKNNGYYTLTAKLTRVDQFGNAVANKTGSSIVIALATGSGGSVSTADGTNALLVLNNSSETSASFTLIRNNPGNTTVTMTATVLGTPSGTPSQTLTVTLSF
jgi:hypothetical protein